MGSIVPETSASDFMMLGLGDMVMLVFLMSGLLSGFFIDGIGVTVEYLPCLAVWCVSDYIVYQPR